MWEDPDYEFITQRCQELDDREASKPPPWLDSLLFIGLAGLFLTILFAAFWLLKE